MEFRVSCNSTCTAIPRYVEQLHEALFRQDWAWAGSGGGTMVKSQRPAQCAVPPRPDHHKFPNTPHMVMPHDGMSTCTFESMPTYTWSAWAHFPGSDIPLPTYMDTHVTRRRDLQRDQGTKASGRSQVWPNSTKYKSQKHVRIGAPHFGEITCRCVLRSQSPSLRSHIAKNPF